MFFAFMMRISLSLNFKLKSHLVQVNIIIITIVTITCTVRFDYYDWRMLLVLLVMLGSTVYKLSIAFLWC